jgi:hypothetical protein
VAGLQQQLVTSIATLTRIDNTVHAIGGAAAMPVKTMAIQNFPLSTRSNS